MNGIYAGINLYLYFSLFFDFFVENVYFYIVIMP